MNRYCNMSQPKSLFYLFFIWCTTFHAKKKGAQFDSFTKCWPGDVPKATTFAHQSGFHQLPLAASLGGGGSANLSSQMTHPDTQDRILNANEQEDSNVRTVGSLEDDLGVFLGELAWEGCSVQVVTLCVLVQWLCCIEEVLVTLWVALLCFPHPKPTWVVSKSRMICFQLHREVNLSVAGIVLYALIKHYSERVLQCTFSLLCETVGAGLGPKALLTFSVECEIPLKVSFHLWSSCVFFFFVSLSFFCLLHPQKVL